MCKGKSHHFKCKSLAITEDPPPSVLPVTSIFALLTDMVHSRNIRIILTVILFSGFSTFPGFPVKREEIGYFQHQEYTAPSRR